MSPVVVMGLLRLPSIVLTCETVSAEGVAAEPVLFPTRVSAPIAAIPPTGSPVAFVRVAEDGVPRAGVTSVGLVARTTFPEPVVDAAEIAVPLPCKSPVTVVERVSAGVAPPELEPASPFAVATETAVTVPLLLNVVQSLDERHPACDPDATSHVTVPAVLTRGASKVSASCFPLKVLQSVDDKHPA